MKSFLLFICLVFANVGYSQSQDKEILTLMLHQFMEGASNNDREAHDKFWAEDLIYTSSSGTRFGKAQIMEGFNNAPKTDESAQTIYSADAIQINLYGNTAVVAFKMKGQTGDVVQYYYNSGTFVKRNERWQVVNWHATKIPTH